MQTLYIVGTPIGNLEDISLRALRVLDQVDVIVCEDTRVTSKLLKHYKINKPLKSFHGFSRASSLQHLVSSFQSVAYVTDAGTPGVSDPGAKLVTYAREIGAQVVSVPGPSALTALLSVAGRELGEFVFRAFPPHKKGRETFFKQIAADLAGREMPTIFYEAPSRVLKALTLLDRFAPRAHVVVGRELTKKFEEVLEGTSAELLAIFGTNPSKLRGEFVVLVT